MESTSLASGGELVAKVLVEEGTKYIFSIPGGHINPIYRACEDEGIRIITTRHEQAAGNAADGWGRMTRHPGVCAVTAGPGVMNLIPALAQALHSTSPIVAIGGRSAIVHKDKCAYQEIDSIAVARPVTRWAELCLDTRRIPEYLFEAFRRSQSGCMGPSYLEIPQDVLTLESDSQDMFPRSSQSITRPYPDPATVKEVAKHLWNANSPVILVGDGVFWADAGKELLALVDSYNFPVAHYWLGKGSIPDEHPCSIGNAVRNPILSEADTILVIGLGEFGELLGFGTDTSLFDCDVKVIQVNISSESTGKNRPCVMNVTADPKSFLVLLKDTLSSLERTNEEAQGEWLKTVQESRATFVEMFESQADSDKIPIKPQRMMKELRPYIGTKTQVILDGGDLTVWGNLFLNASYPGQIMGSHGALGYLGAGIPMGIGAKLASPDREVMVVTGDGSFLFNGCELDTAVRYEIPIVVVIGNDSSWGMIAHGQELAWEKTIGTKLRDDIDYVKFAESFGAKGEMITKIEDIGPAVDRAKKSGIPAVVDIRIDPEEKTVLNYSAAAAQKSSFWEQLRGN